VASQVAWPARASQVSFLATAQPTGSGHVRLLMGACFKEAHSAPGSRVAAAEVETRRFRAEDNDADHFSFDDSGLEGLSLTKSKPGNNFRRF